MARFARSLRQGCRRRAGETGERSCKVLEADVDSENEVTSPAVPDSRRSEMLAFIAGAGTASVAELAREFNVSPVTVHRDLQHLAERGAIQRVRGGARAAPVLEPIVWATDWGSRITHAWPAKQAMARSALELIESGDTLFLDSSTTCFALAKEIEANPPRALTIVTNSPAIIHEVRLEPLHIIVVPGEIDQNLSAITGRWTEEFLSQLNFSTAFISCIGVTPEQGLMSNQRNLSDTLRAAAASASKTIALVDSSKFDLHGLTGIVGLDRLESIITDAALAPVIAERYRRAGVQLVLAPSRPDATASEPHTLKEAP